ncbi:hypothetical protein [Burkholderia pseudomallei]|uniref:hypothetical protein n=1 Tax=Burkholderia pseudomallei TaxID=28450 RepID=UPI000A1A2343|nr:hypothetical protein [Burkholderia pseudomallei]ARL90967.1 hypothetical protein BOC57_34850 [Burkholderia pseudomallei]
MKTTDKTRADALTARLTEFDVLLDGYQEALQDGPLKERIDARRNLRGAFRQALLEASVEQHEAAPIDELVAAWINYPVKTVDGEFAGYEKPELSFTRPAYGYDITMAEPLYRRAGAPAVAPIDRIDRVRVEVYDILANFGQMPPEEDETWESWYAAAFDMAAEQIMNAFESATPAHWYDDGAIRFFVKHQRHRQALRAKPKANPAPSPADKRAAFDKWWKSNSPSNFDYASALAGYLARASSPAIAEDERAALIAERDSAIMSTHRQALCIQQCAAHIGPETAATIDGLPLAVKRVVEERDAARASSANETGAEGATLPQIADPVRWESTSIANELWQLADQCGYKQFRDALAIHIKQAYLDGWEDRKNGVVSVTYGEKQ